MIPPASAATCAGSFAHPPVFRIFDRNFVRRFLFLFTDATLNDSSLGIASFISSKYDPLSYSNHRIILFSFVVEVFVQRCMN
jgi:hypothetical protein